MYKVKVEYFDETLEQTGYVKEMNHKDVFEQTLVELDVNKLAIFLNSK